VLVQAGFIPMIRERSVYRECTERSEMSAEFSDAGADEDPPECRCPGIGGDENHRAQDADDLRAV
jgi:hypothetical protein